MSGVVDSTVVSSVVDAEKKISHRSQTLFSRARYLIDGRLWVRCAPHRTVILTSLLSRAPYPSLSRVAFDATRQSARNADYQHLQEPDLLWTGAILSDRVQKDCQSHLLRDRDFLLDSTINMGLYDHEAANSFLEKSMRYTAVSLSLLYNHVVASENKVIRRLASCIVLKLIVWL